MVLAIVFDSCKMRCHCSFLKAETVLFSARKNILRYSTLGLDRRFRGSGINGWQISRLEKTALQYESQYLQ